MFIQHLIIQLFQLQMKMEIVISWSSAGAKGFKGSRKSTPYAAQVAADDAGAKAFEQGLRTLNSSSQRTWFRKRNSFKIFTIKRI